MAKESYQNIYCLLSSKDFTPFYIGISDQMGNQTLIYLLSKVYEGSTKEPFKQLKQLMSEGYEIYIHDLQKDLEEEDAKALLKHWKTELSNINDYSPFGLDFQNSMRDKFTKK